MSSSMFLQLFVVIVSSLCVVLTSALGTSCGYDACPISVDNRVNVHLVPHTHDDVGWIITVDQYYYRRVQFILDTVIDELLINPERKFTYVEMAFFYRWWGEQNEARKNQVKDLVTQGRLQFTLGGWCMDDEAGTHYADIVDQHTQGLRFLNDTFGDCGRPRVAWQIDPFGHSREHGSLLAQLGYDALYFGRIDYQDEEQRRDALSMEMLWKTSDDLPYSDTSLFTGKLYKDYCTPPGWCFECGDMPVQDNPNLHDFNVAQKVKEFVEMVLDRYSVFKSKHVLIPMGCDFTYENAKKNFKIYDKVIKYVNEYSATHNITVFYSTPACYSKALNDDNIKWPTKDDDFFPYAHRPHSFWTGYFTSRAALKKYVRTTSSYLQTCKQLVTLSNLKQADTTAYQRVDVLRQAMGVVQHHDGVSGTSKQEVAYDYAERLANGCLECEEMIKKSMKKLTYDDVKLTAETCDLFNISFCPFTENTDNFFLQIYNSMSHTTSQIIRLPVTTQYYIVTNEKNEPILSQTIPITNITKQIPEQSGSTAIYDLVFNVSSIPPMGWLVYYVKKANPGDDNVSVFTPFQEYLPSLRFKSRDHLIRRKKDLRYKAHVEYNGIPLPTMGYYYGFRGNNSEPEFQSSGAYIFRPTKQYPESFPEPQIVSVDGPVVKETHMIFSPWASQVIRAYPAAMATRLSYEELEWTVGPIPMSDRKGREVIIVYPKGGETTDPVLYTDANGRQLIKRYIDYRPSWNFNQSEPVAGNYFPINAVAVVNDSSSGFQFQVITDRSQGGGCATPGNLEIMLHRVTMNDDSLGVDEPLQELGSNDKGLVVRGQHWLVGSDSSMAGFLRRELMQKMYRQPMLQFYTQEPKVKVWSGLSVDLPSNINILTLDDLENTDSKLLRIEHIYQLNEDAELSLPVKLDIQNIFTTFTITGLEELTLGANQNRASAIRLKWQTKSANQELDDVDDDVNFKKSIKATIIELKPMEIRTFKINIQYR